MTEGTSCSAARKISPNGPENAPICPPYQARHTLFSVAIGVLHIHLRSIYLPHYHSHSNLHTFDPSSFDTL